MWHSPAAGWEQQINPNQIARIDISRTMAKERVQVRVFLTNADEPYVFDFDSMKPAVEFYERLWSRRTAAEAAAASSSRA